MEIDKPTDKSFFQAVVTKAGRDALDAKGKDFRAMSPEDVRDAGRQALPERLRRKAALVASIGVVACVGILGVLKATEAPADGEGSAAVGAQVATQGDQLRHGVQMTDEQFRNEAVRISQQLGDANLPEAGITVQMAPVNGPDTAAGK